MKKLKPFKGRVRRFAEGGEPDETGTYASGVTLGSNKNISDETRQRAMDRMEAKRTLDELAKARPAVAKPTVKAAPLDTGDETDRLQKRYVAPRAAAKEQRFPSEPPPRKGTLEDPEYRKTLEKKQALESVHPEDFIGGGALKVARAGATALASGMAGKKAASDIMKRAGERAAENRANKAEASELMRRATERAAESRAATSADLAKGARRTQTEAVNKRAAARDADEARMGGEGGAFRKGGSVRGCGIARKGLTKGTMR